MSRPTFYKTRKQYAEPHEVDRIQIQRTVEPCYAPGNEEPLEFECTVDYIPVRTEGFTAEVDCRGRFPLLDISVRQYEAHPPRRLGRSPFNYDHELKYALDDELMQLFSFLREQERRHHANEVSKLERERNHWKERNEENLELLQQACDREVALYNELVLLKRPWWLKLWEALAVKQEP